jgi:hypothetical protein
MVYVKKQYKPKEVNIKKLEIFLSKLEKDERLDSSTSNAKQRGRCSR